MADGETRIVTQPEGEDFRLAHHGAVRVQGGCEEDPLRHRVAGEMVHATPQDRPLVHMLLWDEDCACEVKGRVVVAGDKEAPVELRHAFPDVHRQSHRMETALAEPIHHALQMRTPLQVRFCNTWHVASDYTVEVNLGRNRLLSLRLSGATVAKPQPCDDAPPCAPVVSVPVHP